jgi:hypothetical protein
MYFEKTTTKKYESEWVRKSWITYDDTFRKARSVMKDKLSKCFRCNKAFKDGEEIALVCFKGVGNKVLHNKCTELVEG